MKERIAKLLTVKSIVTLSFTAVMCYLAIKGKVDITDIFKIIIAFYFGTQVEKNNKEV